MKKQFLYYSLAIVFVFGVFGLGNRAAAQVVMTGGYSDTSVSSKDVKRAAKFAVKERRLRTGNTVKLVEVIKAEQQVVAGMNYRLVLRVADKRGRRSTATVVVYEALKNKLSLTDWKAGEHSDL